MTAKQLGMALLVILIVGFIGLTLCGRAWAADATFGEPSRADWFKSLKQPITGHGCCDISDCQETEARQLRDGSWTAIVNGQWKPIPPDKVLAKPLSIDGSAYVCNGAVSGSIYCFVPPIGMY